LGLSLNATAVEFNIPPQALDSALLAFAEQANVQVSVAANGVRGARTAGITGDRSPEDALALLLKDTGLTFTAIGKRTFSVNESPTPREERTTVAASPRGAIRLAQSDAPMSDTQTEPRAEDASNERASRRSQVEEVVVTGTHIRGSTPTSPVITITRQDIDQSGYSQVGDLVRSLPQNFSGGQNPGVLHNPSGGIENQNITNASTINLRGIGTDATLVLLNGRRLAGDGFLQGADISGVPLAALERVEIVTDGASALYGSDAVAGVANMVLRKDYEGLEVSARAGGATQGGGFEQTYGVLGGTAWDTGHVLSNVEYSTQEPIYAHQRRFTSEAFGPVVLMRENSRGSVFVNAEQRLTDALSAHVDALFSERESGYSSQAQATSRALYRDGKTRTFLVNPSLGVELPGSWSGSIDASVSRTNNRIHGGYLGTPGTSFDENYWNTTRSLEVNANGGLAEMPGGMLQLAVGGGYRFEGYSYGYQPLARAGSWEGADRNVRYLYSELLLPLVSPDAGVAGLRKLDLSIAGRVEKYDTFDTTPTPKIGVRYVPFDGLTLRGTWGKSFKAPRFQQLATPHTVYYYDGTEFGATTPGYVLLNYGGDPSLKPERSKSWTLALEWTPASDDSLSVSATYFDINYRDRVVYPITNVGGALSDPVYAPFIVFDPSVEQQAAVIASAQEFTNFSNNYSGSEPYDPSQVIALLEDRYTNATAQKIHGIDFTVRKAFDVGNGGIGVFANASALRLVQQTIQSAPAKALTGTLYNPPKARLRSGLTWSYSGLSATGIVNYISSEIDTNLVPNARVAPWTTLDLTMAWSSPAEAGLLAGVDASLSISNALDRDPPVARGAAIGIPGVYFDSTNTSIVGRFLSLTLRKKL